MTQQCGDTDIVITPTRGRVRVRFAGEVIAETDKALDLREGDYPVRIYVPRAAVKAEILANSDHHTTCPFKGVASYHHLKKGDRLAKNAVWYYPEPCPLVEPVRDHVAFWGEEVTLDVSAA